MISRIDHAINFNTPSLFPYRIFASIQTIFRRFLTEDLILFARCSMGELTHINLIPSGINKNDLDPWRRNYLIKELLLMMYSFLDPSEESKSEISNATRGTVDLSAVVVKDAMISFFDTASFHFVHLCCSSSPRPPAKPPDDGIFFDFEPDTGVLTAKVVEDISEHYVLMPKLLPTQPTVCPNIDTLPSFSSKKRTKFLQYWYSFLLLSYLIREAKSLMRLFGEKPVDDCLD
ncbi:hypothetical protein Tco_1040135 [Tanacetum coccineum]